jgi:hypothetical protein
VSVVADTFGDKKKRFITNVSERDCNGREYDCGGRRGDRQFVFGDGNCVHARQPAVSVRDGSREGLVEELVHQGGEHAKFGRWSRAQMMVNMGILDQINLTCHVFFAICTLTRQVNNIPLWLNALVSNILECLSWFPSNLVLNMLAFERFLMFTNKHYTRLLFDGKKVYVG